MSDLQILLEEIDAQKSIISSAIYLAKSKGDLDALEAISKALDNAVDIIALVFPKFEKE